MVRLFHKIRKVESDVFMKKNKIKLILSSVLIMLILIIGVSYAYFSYSAIGERNEIITGQIYMRYSESNVLSLTNIFPETKEKAFKRTDNIINFTINGKNTSNKDIYYGINLNYGDEIDGMSRIKPEDIMISLERDGEVLIDGIRYSDWDNQRIWVEKIAKNTTSESSQNYSLRIWVDENVLISDSNPKADYTADTWNKSYISLKLGVDGKLETMNMPLSIETSDTFVENNKAYFIAKISNFYDINDLGKTLENADNMNLKITGTNSDIVLSYKDSEGNVVEETSETLDLDYIFNKNKTIEIQVFVTPKNDTNSVTDLNFVLTRNNEEVQRFHKYMTIYGNNFCLNNGFNKLYDCILASDSLATDVETAKVNIKAKGEPNLNDTAPTYTYVEDITYDVENVYSTTDYQFYISDSYQFNPNTGQFSLKNENGSSVITDYLSDAYKDYYTCGGTNVGFPCNTLYKIKAVSVSGTSYTITKGDKITYKIASSIRSEVGLYKVEDDYGDSYVFRGDVSNNNVLFGGYYWKIVRTNGDNSIRLIYNGTTPNASGYSIGINGRVGRYSAKYPLSNSPIGERKTDPTYVGYMYGKNFERKVSEETSYTSIGVSTKYYFGDDYEFDPTNEVFKLKTKSLEPISKTFTEMNETDTTTGKKLYELYPYTCKAITNDSYCEVIIQVNGIVSGTKANVQYHSYSSVDSDGTRTNEFSSNAKTQLESWYSANIVGKNDGLGNLITEYIVDGTFCNDRGTPNSMYASGYLLNQYTYYAPYIRLNGSNILATLKCSDIRDQFSHTSSKGNGLLTYPIALITADELSFAGGYSGKKNNDFYLKGGTYFWTMSPAYFSSAAGEAIMWGVDGSGTMSRYYSVTNGFVFRAVINLRSDVLISSGDGTVSNPFTLKLA